MDVNNMKVTDLKKELKARGLSIVGNKSELVARMTEALTTDGDTIAANNGSHNEDSALEEQLLGDESVADETINKTDDHLIDDLLNTTEPKDKKVKTVMSSDNKSPTKVTALTGEQQKTTTPLSPSKAVSDDSAVNALKTTTAIKVLSADERKQLRTQKFGDNKLSERANRFGIKAEGEQTTASPIKVDEKLQKRAQRFGAIVSEKMKQIDNSQKLLQRKERFGNNTTSNVKTTTTTTTTDSEIAGSGKRKITFSSDSNDQKQKRLERFGKFL